MDPLKRMLRRSLLTLMVLVVVGPWAIGSALKLIQSMLPLLIACAILLVLGRLVLPWHRRRW